MLLRRRLQALALTLAALVVLNYAVDRVLVTMRNHQRDDVRALWEPARDDVSDLQIALGDQHAAAREYVITVDESFIDTYRTSGSRADAALAALDRRIGGVETLVPYLDRVSGRVTAWRQLGANYEIRATAEGREAQAVDLVATGTSRQLFDEARLEIDELRTAILDELREREARIERLEEWIGVFRLVSALAAVAAVGLTVAGLRRWLTRPLGVIVDATRTVARGALDYQIPKVGPPELRDLGADVEAMRRRIREEVDDAARARSSLAQRGMVILALREQLAPSDHPIPPPGLATAVRFKPAESLIAGDWYELLRTGDSTYAFAIGDVAGHGQEAGVFALRTKQMVQIALRDGHGPAAVWGWVAEHLHDTGEQFLTGVIGVVDVSRRILTYANAGHPPLLRLGATVDALAPTGPVVGPFAGVWDEASVPFREGETMVAYSDGLLEVRAVDGAWAELDALASHLAGGRGAGPDDVVEQCLTFHEQHYDTAHVDDITVIAIGAVPDPSSHNAVGGIDQRVAHLRSHR